MSVIDAQRLRKAYGPQTVLEDVSLSIGDTERVGLVGVNGAGKSTLARILAGLEPADGGEVALRRGARVAYLPQTPVLDPDRTAREEVMAGLHEWRAAEARYQAASAALAGRHGELDKLVAEQAQAAAELERLGGWELAHRAEAVLGHLGIARIDERASSMSGGEQRRVNLAAVLVAAPALAILDEPTNHLDVETVEWLERHLVEDFAGAVLLTTHDRYLLDRVATRIIEIERGTVRSYEGNYRDYLEAKAERLAHEARVEANRQNLLRRELEWVRRQPKARTTKQKARIQRAAEAVAAVPPPPAETVHLSIESTRAGKSILEVQGLGIEVAGRTLVRGLDLALRRGQRLGIIGPNGCGKTTLLRTLVGELAPAGGRLVVGKNTRWCYLGQLRDDLDEDQSILDNVAAGRSHVVVGDRAVHARAYLDRFLFPGHRLDQKVSSLSGGERTRVALARMLHQATNLVLLDEPANDLDLPTIAALEEMLIEFDGTALVVTHDRALLDRVATGILAFEGDGEVVLYEGSYSTYISLRAARGAGPAAAAPEHRPAPRGERKRPSRPASLTYAERLELAAIVGKIEEAEARVAELEARLADPAIYRNGGQEVVHLNAELKAARDEATRLMERWEALEIKQGGG